MKRLIALALLVLAAVAGPALPVAAGGWAVSTLDDVPAPQAGQAVEVGWTIRQHGVRPVNPEDGDVGIMVRSPSGTARYFPARQQGPTGHYVADVVFPEAGASSWSIRQGWFPEQDLGAITVVEPRTVAPGAGSAATSGRGAAAGDSATPRPGPADAARDVDRGSAFVRYGFPALATLLVAAALADLLTARRRSRRPAPA